MQRRASVLIPQQPACDVAVLHQARSETQLRSPARQNSFAPRGWSLEDRHRDSGEGDGGDAGVKFQSAASAPEYRPPCSRGERVAAAGTHPSLDAQDHAQSSCGKHRGAQKSTGIINANFGCKAQLRLPEPPKPKTLSPKP